MTTQIDRAQVQDGGIFQCQVFVRDEVVPSSPIEVVLLLNYIIYMHQTNINWMTLSTFFSFSGDNRSSLRVYICWHAQQQQADGPLLQLPDDDPPLYDAPGDSLDDSSIFSNNNSSRYFNVCVCVW